MQIKGFEEADDAPCGGRGAQVDAGPRRFMSTQRPGRDDAAGAITDGGHDAMPDRAGDVHTVDEHHHRSCSGVFVFDDSTIDNTRLAHRGSSVALRRYRPALAGTSAVMSSP